MEALRTRYTKKKGKQPANEALAADVEQDLAFLATTVTTILSSPTRRDQILPPTTLLPLVLGQCVTLPSSQIATLVQLVFSAWDTIPAALPQALRTTIEALLRICPEEDGAAVPARVLLEALRTAEWYSKRTLLYLHSALPFLPPSEVEACIAGEEPGGLFGRLLAALDLDELATTAGRVAVDWLALTVPPVSHGSEQDHSWLDQTLEALRGGPRQRNNASIYFLQLVFKERPSSLKELVARAGWSEQSPSSSQELEAAMAVYRAANTLGMITQGSTSTSINHIAFPVAVVGTSITRQSPSLRSSALSLLVISTSTSLPVPLAHLDLLRTFYSHAIGEEDASLRVQILAFSVKLFTRLRESCARGAVEYRDAVKAWLEWLAGFVLHGLNPARPFRIQQASLRLLESLLQSAVDPRFGPAQQFAAKGKAAKNNETRNWPFAVSLVDPRSTFTLLRLLLSSYRSLRATSLELLSTFSAPLPGVTEQGARELMERGKAMQMSGRESEANAGAGLLSLVWTKSTLLPATDSSLASSAGSSRMRAVADMMEKLEGHVAAFERDLGSAARTTPMHGTLLSLRLSLCQLGKGKAGGSLLRHASVEEWRKVFQSILSLVTRIWAVSKDMLNLAPEGQTGEGEDGEEDEEAEEMEVGESIAEKGEEQKEMKVVLSATWRAMKEVGELVEVLITLPALEGNDVLLSTWRSEEIKELGVRYAEWLGSIRHRGAFMAIYPCYSRVASALLRCQGLGEEARFPAIWLQDHLEALVSKNSSITRRSGGVPFCIIGLMLALNAPEGNRDAVAAAFVRLFETAESDDETVLDESRVHAMNTIRTAFLDGRLLSAVTRFVGRGFELSIKMFWSTNWICRNAAMMLFAASVTKAFGRRLNLPRDHTNLRQRISISDFFERYPSLHTLLVRELETASKHHKNDLPSVDLQSSLFAVLMVLSLLQTMNTSTSTTAFDFSSPFIPLVEACGRSRVWKIRDAAADALTGLVAPEAVLATVARKLDEAASGTSENEVHALLVQAKRLLDTLPPLGPEAASLLHDNLCRNLSAIFTDRHSFSSQSAYLATGFHASAAATSSSPLVQAAQDLLNTAAGTWSAEVVRLPGAESLLVTALTLLHACSALSTETLEPWLTSPWSEVQMMALSLLPSSACPTVLRSILLDARYPVPARIACARHLAGSTQVDILPSTGALELLGDTKNVPLFEAALPLAAAASVQTPQAQVFVLQHIRRLLQPQQSFESRLSAARALAALVGKSSAPKDEWVPLVLQALQDDDPEVREAARVCATQRYPQMQETADSWLCQQLVAEAPAAISMVELLGDLEHELQALSSPSKLVFAPEKPNVFVDDVLLVKSFRGRPLTRGEGQQVADAVRSLLASAKASGASLSHSPLGVLGSAAFCKWAYILHSLATASDKATTTGVDVEPETLQFLAESFEGPESP